MATSIRDQVIALNIGKMGEEKAKLTLAAAVIFMTLYEHDEMQCWSALAVVMQALGIDPEKVMELAFAADSDFNAGLMP